MNKTLFLISILFLILFASAGALASQDMINPYFVEANNLPEIREYDDALTPRGGVSVKLSVNKDPSLKHDAVFKASASGGNGNYEYCFYIIDPTEISKENPSGDPHCYSGPIDSSEYRYRFVVPGTYQVLVYAKDSKDNVWDAANSMRFTIKEKGAKTTSDYVRDLVEKCKKAGCKTDYEKALWYHDWLTENAYYDTSYSYYSADGVLVRGTGVCDSYSKAYLMLLEASGIEVKRVTNYNHAWNLVKLDGHWYHIDPTFDDPIANGNETSKVTGYEHHMYFGLPDDVMKLDRSFRDYSSDTEATGMEYNYFIQTGKHSIWTDSIITKVNRSLKSGFDFSFTLPNYYKLETGKNGYGKQDVIYNICEYALNKMDWNYDGQDFGIAFDYHEDSDSLYGGIEFTDDRNMSLPAALSGIGDEAFSGPAKYLSVYLPEGIESIGANAFSDNPGLWKITIPESVTSIDKTALSGSDNVTIFCAEGSVAEAFAKDAGIRFRYI